MAKRYDPIYNWTRQAGRFISHPADRAAIMRELDGHIEDRIEAYARYRKWFADRPADHYPLCR